MSIPALEAATGIRRGRLELLVKVLAVEGAVERTVEGWQATGRPWTYDRDRYAALLAARDHEAALMRAYARSQRCLEGVLRESLDDPASADCGRCSVCRGVLPEGLAAAPTEESIRAALAFLRGSDVVLEPRKQWASGLARTGRISAGVSIQPGRALAYANDPAWPEAVRLVNGTDAELTPDVLDGLTQVLVRWREAWAERPSVIVPVPSARHPRLVRSLAERIGEVGRLRVVDALAVEGVPGDADVSARARAQVQAGRITLLPGTSLAGETVLLVDDAWRSGWTATIAGALLREAGAEHVLPLVIQQRP